jgi:hypothetical protein
MDAQVIPGGCPESWHKLDHAQFDAELAIAQQVAEGQKDWTLDELVELVKPFRVLSALSLGEALIECALVAQFIRRWLADEIDDARRFAVIVPAAPGPPLGPLEEDKLQLAVEAKHLNARLRDLDQLVARLRMIGEDLLSGDLKRADPPT